MALCPSPLKPALCWNNRPKCTASCFLHGYEISSVQSSGLLLHIKASGWKNGSQNSRNSTNLTLLCSTDESSVQSERTTYDGQKYPSQTSGRTLHHHPPPPTARIVGTTSLTGSSSSSSIPEEMYNLFQLAEVSLAASSSGGEAVGFHPSHALLDRWRVLKANPTVLMDKPLDLSRETSNSNGAAAPRIILTPSPSPTPSESHLTLNLGLRKMSGTDGTNDLLVMSEESEVEDSSSCYSPDDSISCRSVEVGNKPASSGSRSGSNSDNNSHSGDGHECPDCGKRYSTSSNLARHRQTHRSPADQKVCKH